MKMLKGNSLLWGLGLSLILSIVGCAGKTLEPATYSGESPLYKIGPGDSLTVFVWGSPELTTTVPVRPDGKISVPLVEDVQASGKTPTALAKDMQKHFKRYVKNPVVTVIVTGFVGRYNEQVRVVGEAAKPQALAYRENMTLLDVMIAVGGLSKFAAGNSAKLIRTTNGEKHEHSIYIEDLLNDGDISANVDILPGDIILIPESWF